MLALGLGACGSSGSDGEPGPVAVEAGSGAAPGGWERLPDPPLAPRARVVSVWTGREAIFVGGDRFLCPPGDSCVAPDEPPFADGAAFDPGTRSWRPIAPSPVAFSDASTAVVGDDVYFLAMGVPGVPGNTPAFLRYAVGDDAWHELPFPGDDPGWYHLVGAGEVLVAHTGTDEQGERPDLVFDPRGDEGWTELPADPLSPAFDRRMVWSGEHLHLFDHALVANPGSERPSLTRAARLDLVTGAWERLPDSAMLGTSPWFVEDGVLVNPDLGSADGGEVNGWGRSHPYGGSFDTGSASWSPLPAAPDTPEGVDAHSAGVIGSTGGLAVDTHGWLLDLRTDTWIELPEVPDPPEHTRRNVVAAGTDLVAFGGERWSDGGDPGGEVLGDAWIWRSG